MIDSYDEWNAATDAIRMVDYFALRSRLTDCERHREQNRKTALNYWARLAEAEAERDLRMAQLETHVRANITLEARLAEAERLLQEVYDGRQSLMSVGLVYRIGHTLNHRPADSADEVQS